jgi:tRNA pseudouridine synthase 10
LNYFFSNCTFYRLQTQAGTYIKEFIHGDFGRTTPSVGEIFGIGADKVDIVELDVEAVELEWPPQRSQKPKNGTQDGLKTSVRA